VHDMTWHDMTCKWLCRKLARNKMHNILFPKLKGRDNFEELYSNARIILKWVCAGRCELNLDRGVNWTFSIHTNWANISFPKRLFHAVNIHTCLNQRCAKCGLRCNIRNTEQKALNSTNHNFLRIVEKPWNTNLVILCCLTSINSASC
jgi:hypothetical protein